MARSRRSQEITASTSSPPTATISTSSSGSSGRRRRNNVLDSAFIRESGLEVVHDTSLENMMMDFEGGYGPDEIIVLSTSFFSTISIEDVISDHDGQDDDEIDLDLLLPPNPSVEISGHECYNRISRQGRKVLRSSRLPIEHILEFESLIFDHLRSKTPRRRLLSDNQHFFTVSIQNPFRRSLLHSVCQYYRLSSQTVDKAVGLTVIKATQQTSALPVVRLSDYLVTTFGHMLPS